MTRARFLSLVASLPIAAQTPPAESGSLRSGSLLITAGTEGEDTLLLAKPDLSSSQTLVKGKGLASVLASDKSALYAAHGQMLDDKLVLELSITQFANPRWEYAIYYPGSFAGRSWGLAISPDGRYLYTFLDSFAYTFDTLAGNFLPQKAEGLRGGNFIARNSREFDQYLPDAHIFRRYRLSKDGNVSSTDDIPSPAGGAEKAAQFQRCSTGANSYFVHADGLVLIASDVYKVARVDPVPQGSQVISPTVSADGKLLFVPTGSPPYIERISVYETAGFSRIAQLQPQIRFRSLTANLDGSRLYATQLESRIGILDATTLAEKKTARYPYSSIGAITVVP